MPLKIAVDNYLKTFLISKLGKDCVLHSTTFGTRKFNCANTVEIWRTTQYGKEEKSLGAFLFLLQQNDVIWDIGASVGLYTVYAAELVKTLLSFEPDPAIFSRLKSNIALNNLTNVTPNQLAIGDKDGAMTLHSNGVDGNSPTLISNLNRHSNAVSVQVRSIDSLIKEGFPPPTVIKMDIEGAEGLALRGASELLKSDKKPRMIFVELHPKFLTKSEPQEILDLLKECGYKNLSTQKRDEEFHLIATL